VKKLAKSKVKGKASDLDRAGKSIGQPVQGSLAHHPDGSHVDLGQHEGSINPVVFEHTPPKRDEGIIDSSASVTTQISKTSE